MCRGQLAQKEALARDPERLKRMRRKSTPGSYTAKHMREMLETYRRTVESAEVSVGNWERYVRRDKERLRRAETALKALPREERQR